MKISPPIYVAFFLLGLGTATLRAVDYTWTNGSTALWTVTTGWSPTAPTGGPTGSDNVLGTTGSNLQLGATAHSINNFTATTTTFASWALQSGATVASTLNVLGTFTMNSDKSVFVQRNPGASTATLTLNAADISVVNTNGTLFLGNTGEASALHTVSVSGATTVNAGARLRMNVTNSADLGALTANGLVSLVATTNNDISRTVTVASLAGSGTVNGNASSGLNSSANLIINGSSTTTFSGVIANGNNSVVSLAKRGSGVQRLTGNNTYSGATAVEGGALIINGTNSGTGILTVSSGATLGGSGTVGGETTISGIHSPGNSPGIQTFGNSLTYTSGALFIWELAANTVDPLARGVSFDGVNITGGNLDFDGPVSTTLNFSTGVTWSDSLWGSDYLGTSGWLVYSLTGGGTIGDFANLSLADIDWVDSGSNALSTARSGASFSLYQSGDDIYLNYTVPEPSTYALLLLASTGLGVHLLRRHRRS